LLSNPVAVSGTVEVEFGVFSVKVQYDQYMKASGFLNPASYTILDNGVPIVFGFGDIISYSGIVRMDRVYAYNPAHVYTFQQIAMDAQLVDNIFLVQARVSPEITLVNL
jgi:hypothetical protein